MTDRPAGARSSWRSSATRCLALAAVAFDVADIRLSSGYGGPFLTLAALVAVLCLNDSDVPLLGMRFFPVQGWRYWGRMAVRFGFWIGVLCVAAGGVWMLLGHAIPIVRTPPSFSAFFQMCMYAPIAEEIVYRSLLTVAIAPTLGERSTILASGLVFALIHILRGNASPENQIAGFLLEWAFLRSGTILVPIAMHSAGNLIALGFQVGGWYWFAYSS
jgi:membrane protease YdiL (CAAX protease family)